MDPDVVYRPCALDIGQRPRLSRMAGNCQGVAGRINPRCVAGDQFIRVYMAGVNVAQFVAQFVAHQVWLVLGRG